MLAKSSSAFKKKPTFSPFGSCAILWPFPLKKPYSPLNFQLGLIALWQAMICTNGFPLIFDRRVGLAGQPPEADRRQAGSYTEYVF